MRRHIWHAILLGLVLVATLVSPASAHQVGARDPFDPAITVGVAGDTTTGVVAPAPDVDVVPAAGPRRGLPSTGASIDGWILLAYSLIALGGALLLWTWSRRPAWTASVRKPSSAI